MDKTDCRHVPTVSPANAQSAFTRAELILVVLTLSLLIVAALPLLANTSRRGDRVGCVNNLRLISRAFHQWATEHGDSLPWWVPPPEGVTADLRSCYLAVSNELPSPKFLADPADRRASLSRAVSWGNDFNGGFQYPGYGNNSISYWLGLYATPLQPLTLISGDRNIQTAGISSSCVGGSACRELTPETARWTNSVDGLHGEQGNFAYIDGRVEQADTADLKRAINWNPDPGTSPTRYWNSRFAFP